VVCDPVRKCRACVLVESKRCAALHALHCGALRLRSWAIVMWLYTSAHVTHPGGSTSCK
jgi:hypothetical protein